MATQSKRQSSSANASTASSVNTEEALKPFREAAKKFSEAASSAQEAAAQSWAQAQFDLQDAARKLEQEAHSTVAERNKKLFAALGQETSGSFEEIYTSRAKLHLEHENEVRKVYVETQEKLADLVQKLGSEQAGDITNRLETQQQEAYQAYLGDLRQAWSETSSLDPQTISAITQNILSTIHSCYR